MLMNLQLTTGNPVPTAQGSGCYSAARAVCTLQSRHLQQGRDTVSHSRVRAVIYPVRTQPPFAMDPWHANDVHYLG